ncbi:uncharacterized protein [Drosophila tropicalis]|uniref:uncharacterized protein n=1 Tax=Drosophila tropicalis TaxID=46794 RepID=UPI0035AC1257
MMKLVGCPDELPNPYRNCIKDMLNTLICNDNDVKRLNTELRNLQLELKSELNKANLKCGHEKKKTQTSKLCESDEKLETFAKRIASLDEVKFHYSERSEELRKRRHNIIVYARQCLRAYNEEKCKFKGFHENTIDYIKRTATLSHDPEVIARCEKDICQMQKRFTAEVANIKRSESVLLPFFQLIKQTDAATICECSLKDYDWVPQGKNLESVNAAATDMKDQMGKVLIRAFAQLHMHMPQDPRSFIAGYLMNVDRNEQEMKEKLDIFQASEMSKEMADPTFQCENACPASAKEDI